MIYSLFDMLGIKSVKYKRTIKGGSLSKNCFEADQS